MSTATNPALTRLLARLEPALRKRFLTAIRAVQNNLDVLTLAAALQSGNITRAEALLQMQTWPEKFGGLAIDLRAGFMGGTTLGTSSLEHVGIALTFTYVDTFTVEYARRRLPKLVQSFNAGARELVRTIVAETVEGQYTPFEAAQDIVEHIGLTAQQSASVRQFKADLEARGIGSADVKRRVGVYKESQLKLRAETIARTEIQSAANDGQLETWKEATRQGLLPREAKKQWEISEDERLCSICESLGAADPVPLNAQFEYDDGKKATTVFGEPLFAPPAHPSCRCAMTIEL